MFKAKPSKCKICGETFRSRNKLWAHLRAAHNMGEIQYRKIYGDPEKPEEEKTDANSQDNIPETTVVSESVEQEDPLSKPETGIAEEEVEPEINIVDYQMIPYSGIVALYKDGDCPVVALGTVTYNQSISQLSPLVLTPEGLVMPAFLLEEFSGITMKKDGVKTKKKPRLFFQRKKVKSNRNITDEDVEKVLALLNRR